jgi:hypothetical protein
VDENHLATALRKAVEAAMGRGESMTHVAGGSGVGLPALSQFLAGKRDLRLRMASKLARYLGLALRKGGK